MSIYDFSVYEDYLKDVLKQHESERGYMSKLAQAIGTHPSYVTRVLRGEAQLTPDQACSLSEFWGHNSAESEYFLWLVIKDRSGTPLLKKKAEIKLRLLKNENDQLGRYLSAETFASSDINEYYLSWHYPAIHILLTLNKMPTEEEMSQRLGLPLTTVRQVLLHLEKMQIISLGKNGKPIVLKKNIHLPQQSWMASIQHKNWRVMAAERIGRLGQEDMRYSGMHSLSKKDFAKLKRKVREFLLDVDSTVRPSAEETVCFLGIDLFEL